MGSKRNKNREARRDAPVTPSAVLDYRTPIVEPVSAGGTTQSNLAGFLAWAFTALILVGYIIFRLEGTLAMGTRMSVDRAMFTVVNAATLTGFQGSLAIDNYNPLGQWTILLLTIGGTQFALIAGGIAVTRIARLPYSDRQIAIVWLFSQIAVLILGVIFLHQPDQPIVVELLQSTSAFGNSGVWMGSPPEVLDPRTHFLLLPLALLGGFGLPVLMDLFDAARRKRSLSNHTMAVLKLSALVYVVAVVVLFIFRFPDSPQVARHVLASSSQAAINTRSAGLPIEFAADFPRFLQWFLVGLMMIGAAPGSAGGGLKVTTVGRLFAGVRDCFAGRAQGKIFGIAVVWLLGFLAVTILCFLFLLWSEPGLEADRLFTLAASAASCTGLSHDRVGIVGPGLFALSITMLLGRILPIFVLWWVVKYADQTDVAIG